MPFSTDERKSVLPRLNKWLFTAWITACALVPTVIDECVYVRRQFLDRPKANGVSNKTEISDHFCAGSIALGHRRVVVYFKPWKRGKQKNAGGKVTLPPALFVNTSVDFSGYVRTLPAATISVFNCSVPLREFSDERE